MLKLLVGRAIICSEDATSALIYTLQTPGVDRSEDATTRAGLELSFVAKTLPQHPSPPCKRRAWIVAWTLRPEQGLRFF